MSCTLSLLYSLLGTKGVIALMREGYKVYGFVEDNYQQPNAMHCDGKNEVLCYQ